MQKHESNPTSTHLTIRTSNQLGTIINTTTQRTTRRVRTGKEKISTRVSVHQTRTRNRKIQTTVKKHTESAHHQN